MKLIALNSFFANDDAMDKIMFIHGEKTYSKKHIAELIKKYIKKAKQIKGDDCVLCSSDNLLFIIAFFALLHSKKNIILSSNTRESTLKMLGVNDVFSDENLDFEIDENAKNIEIEPFDIKTSKVIFFTSGSTGIPKKIYKSFKSLSLELNSIEEELEDQIKPNTTTIATVNFFHLYGMSFAFLYSISKGFTIDTKLIETPEELNYRLEKYQNSFLVTSPAFMDRLARYKENYNFSKKPYLMTSSGGVLSEAGAVAAKELFEIYPNEVFGSTETGVVGVRKQMVNKVWKLFPFTKAERGEDGNLVVKSDFLDEDEYVMGDEVEFVDNEHFILKGRLDRMVKIEEKRVSLPELEKTLNEHRFVEKAYCLPILNKNNQKKIGACISLSLEGRDFLISFGRQEIINELKSHMKKFTDKIASPAKWRFVDEIPTNSQSKILVDEIENIFSSNICEPVVINKDLSKDSVVYDLIFLKSSSYFEGHFPNFHLLPAVAQIQFAMYFANKNWKDKIPNFSVKINKMTKIKFSNMIRPDTKVRLNISKTEESISFKYFDNDGNSYSSGTIVL